MAPENTIGPVMVELTGVTPPAWFARLSDALAATWAAMRLLPLDNANYRAFELNLARPRSLEYMTERLERDNAVSLTFILPDGPHLLHLRRAHKELGGPPDGDGSGPLFGRAT
ncbi:hypothetical protein OG455_09550 [Kitasatospora sp. NBC_01287]|uniref:hypothetical protein n=1 Tax=Kitasatospora sp. NBC_01287 TaxID=2903573 RepID=UPI00224CAC03|nr:hypothetical protein [Kitasatospora sp. NBC_01287]MCX4745764.1 hypothetical protein [Kitasatospora sp. NBC_01287]